jgi:hypothetical protein
MMDTKLTFKVESGGRPYAVMTLRNGFVTARIGRRVLRQTVLPFALRWVEAFNPQPGCKPIVRIVGRFQGGEGTEIQHGETEERRRTEKNT